MPEPPSAYVLNKGSRTEFSAGSKCAHGRAYLVDHDDDPGKALIAAFNSAAKAFKKEFGRLPERHKGVAFRGAVMSFEVVVEICEPL